MNESPEVFGPTRFDPFGPAAYADQTRPARRDSAIVEMERMIGAPLSDVARGVIEGIVVAAFEYGVETAQRAQMHAMQIAMNMQDLASMMHAEALRSSSELVVNSLVAGGTNDGQNGTVPAGTKSG